MNGPRVEFAEFHRIYNCAPVRGIVGEKFAEGFIANTFPSRRGGRMRVLELFLAGRNHRGRSARVMPLIRRYFPPPGMPDAFDRAPLR
jgi:hypothetical protein